MYFKTRKKLENIYLFKVYRPAMPIVTFSLGRYGCRHIQIIPKHICLRQMCAYAPAFTIHNNIYII